MTADTPATGVSGQFVTMHGERYYAIRNVDRMEPFFVSVVSDSDHWLFAASNGGLTAGRVSPDTALFPYITVDKIYDSTLDTGPRTFIRVHRGDTCSHWEPFNRQHDSHYTTERNLYKNLLGNKLLFEEINHDLGLAFRYGWSFSDSFGFVRRTEVAELAGNACRLELLDGVQNILPAGTPRFTQTNSSYLVDAYKWSELDEQTGLALYSLFSAISDRAEPCESLRTTTAFCLGLDSRGVLLSTTQVERFRGGGDVRQETLKRGVRGAYFVDAEVPLAGGATAAWQIVTNVEQTQAEAVKLIQRLADPEAVARKIEGSIAAGSDALARIQAAADAYQTTAEETVSAHHYANVLYNVLRGGIVDDQYRIDTGAFAGHLALFNAAVAGRYEAWLDALPDKLDHAQLMEAVREQNDAGLTRLALEYLPITFGRRHGDPSRPWNQFAIRLTDSEGNRLLTYQGNWRDIFQNWEALLLSYPQFVDSIIAKFVNASTIDGYNPYRITNEGFDWEVEEPDDPWSYIGYWGDHQIIYLQKLLELSRQFHPDRLDELLHEPLFCYANVPYRIRSFDRIVANPKTTVDYDDDLAARIEVRVSELGADGKLVMNPAGEVCQVNLLEKLLVTLLAKLGNLVIDGGIWLNTQRPEWNDANNALVGQGLSMVTLYYMRRYVRFLARLLSDETRQTRLSSEVGRWLAATAAALAQARGQLGEGPVDPEARHRLLTELGEAASRYRETVYQQGWPGEAVAQDIEPLRQLLEDATAAIDHSIRSNRRDDGLYHAYNLLELEGQSARVDTLYPMLEGQVAALSSGAIPPAEAVSVLEALFASEVYRADQHTFLLYPDRDLPCFLEKNRVPADGVAAIPLLTEMEKRGDTRLVERDAGGTWRFHADLTNVDSLGAALDALAEDYGDAVATARAPLRDLYEQVFNHKAFTGRSGGMFGFEGLGSIYWHMVSKLLLAVQENFFAAHAAGADSGVCHRLGELYYRVRKGIGFNKTPEEYGAFPTDPYSHTPGHIGAQQPGMTGQVKEEILTRFGELGIRVDKGTVRFEPGLLRSREFLAEPAPLRYVDVDGQWQELDVPSGALAFTWCQVPIVYQLDDEAAPTLTLTRDTGETEVLDGASLEASLAEHLFLRTGGIRRIDLTIGSRQLFAAS